MKYITTFFLVFIFGIIIYAGISKFTGIFGRTEKNGVGCTCHSSERDNAVQVTITGPDTLFKGQSGEYQIRLSGGAAVQGGFNVASLLGSLNPVDASAQLLVGELTHTSPKSFAGGSVSWSFNYTAANQVYTDTIFSAGNSVNGDGFSNSEDRWNFGQRFVVHVIDQVSSVEENNVLVNNFKLDQNYPNPFNPVSTIRYSIPSVTLSLSSRAESRDEGSRVQLKIYDVLGNEVATLVNEYKSAGTYELEFNAAKYTSGVYFYRLQADSFVDTKKMILLR